MQLLCLTAMEPPISLSADAVRDEKVKVLRSAPARWSAARCRRNVVRGQYARGFVRGDEVPAYREEPDVVAATRRVETYVAMKVLVDNWRWGGVPFYVRAGKRLARRVTEIAIAVQEGAAHPLPRARRRHHAQRPRRCASSPTRGSRSASSRRSPGSRPSCATWRWTSATAPTFGSNTPEAYERLLLDAMRGEATLFTRRDEVEEQWAYIDHVFEAWAAEGQPPPLYPAGSWGPEQADDLLARDGRRWRRP